MSTQPNENEAASPAEPRSSAATPSWLWGIVGVIVLVALVGGGLGGFQIGREYERNQGDGPYGYQDTYWLIGALLVDRDQAVAVENIATGGPADVAALEEGDRLVAIDNQPVNNASEARRILKGYGGGTSTVLTIERNNLFEQHTLMLGYVYYPCPLVEPCVTPPPVIIYPPQPSDTYTEARLGVYYRMIQPGDPFTVNEGALIITVWPGSPAQAAGLEASDIVVKVGNRWLSRSYTLEDALNRYSPGDRVQLGVWDHRTGNTVTLWARLNDQ